MFNTLLIIMSNSFEDTCTHVLVTVQCADESKVIPLDKRYPGHSQSIRYPLNVNWRRVNPYSKISLLLVLVQLNVLKGESPLTWLLASD